MNKFTKILLATMFIIILTSCNNSHQKELETNYEEKLIIDRWMQAGINCVNMNDDTIYFSTYEEVGELNGELTSNNRIYAIKKNETQPQEISIEIDKEYQHIKISDIICNNKMISFWISTSDPDEYNPVNLLIQMDMKYNILTKKDLNQIVNNENILKVLQSSKGYYICMSTNNLYVIDNNLNLVESFSLDGNAIGITFTNEDKLLCLKKDHDKKKIMIFDIDNLIVEKEFTIDSCNADSEYGIISSKEYDFNYISDDGIYGYNITNNKSICIFNYDKYGIKSEEIEDIFYSDMNEITFSILSNEGEGSKIALYSQNNNQIKKTKIIYGAFQINTEMRNAIHIFNKNNDEYIIETKEYFNEDESYNDAIRKLNEDIASGKVPDILDLSLLSNQYISIGLYEDMSNYITNSQKINEDILLENVLEAMKTNDKLYTITPGFSISTLICKNEGSEKYNELNIQKMKQISNELENGDLLLVANSKDELLSIMLEGNLSDYFNLENGTCQFNSEDFKQLLEFCNEFQFDNIENLDKQELIHQNKMSLVSETNFIPSDIINYRNLFGDEITYIGYPNNNGSNSYFVFENQIGIYSNSNKKDGAWKFIEMILSYDYQKRFIDIYSDDSLIPSRKDCYNELLDNMISSEEIKISIEEKDNFSKMVNSTQKCSSYDITVMKIILEESQVYFNGKKSIDEIVNLIQSRCETYMNEMR